MRKSNHSTITHTQIKQNNIEHGIEIECAVTWNVCWLNINNIVRSVNYYLSYTRTVSVTGKMLSTIEYYVGRVSMFMFATNHLQIELMSAQCVIYTEWHHTVHWYYISFYIAFIRSKWLMDTNNVPLQKRREKKKERTMAREGKVEKKNLINWYTLVNGMLLQCTLYTLCTTMYNFCLTNSSYKYNEQCNAAVFVKECLYKRYDKLTMDLNHFTTSFTIFGQFVNA